jgi:phosphoribosylglycinamide formyltransferase-1
MLSPHRPLRVAVLCSHRAPGLLHLLNRTPDRGATFEIACVLSSELTFAEEVRVERRGIPTLAHPIRGFYDARGASLLHDARVRAEYDRETAAILEPFMPDLLVLDGYRYLVTTPLMAAFPARIIGLQFGDLTIRHPGGPPMFSGPYAVRDAILAGCAETHATVHLVAERPDEGAPIVRSWPFPVSPLVEALQSQTARDAIDAYIFAHQQWMARTASGPLLAAALRLIATDAVDLRPLAERPPAWPWQLEPDGELYEPEHHSLLEVS